jgi:hypothetical protein
LNKSSSFRCNTDGSLQKYIPSSAAVEVSFGYQAGPNVQVGDESDEDPTIIDLPDATPRREAPVVRGMSLTNSRAQKWAAQEGSSSRVNIGRMGQGVSVTGHNSKNKVIKTKSGISLRSAVSPAALPTSNKLSRLGSKVDGFR